MEQWISKDLDPLSEHLYNVQKLQNERERERERDQKPTTKTGMGRGRQIQEAKTQKLMSQV